MLSWRGCFTNKLKVVEMFRVRVSQSIAAAVVAVEEDDDNDVVVAGDFDTSFDTSEILPHDESRSPLPLSEAQNRLDDSVRFMLQSASDLNGKLPVPKNYRSVSQQNNSRAGNLDSSFESNPDDVVRIRVPYKKSHSTSPPPMAMASSAALSSDLMRYDGNRVRIPVNYVSPLTTPTNSPPEKIGSSSTTRNSVR